jgi:hypothetical protein
MELRKVGIKVEDYSPTTLFPLKDDEIASLPKNSEEMNLRIVYAESGMINHVRAHGYVSLFGYGFYVDTREINLSNAISRSHYNETIEKPKCGENIDLREAKNYTEFHKETINKMASAVGGSQYYLVGFCKKRIYGICPPGKDGKCDGCSYNVE